MPQGELSFQPRTRWSPRACSHDSTPNLIMSSQISKGPQGHLDESLSLTNVVTETQRIYRTLQCASLVICRCNSKMLTLNHKQESRILSPFNMKISPIVLHFLTSPFPVLASLNSQFNSSIKCCTKYIIRCPSLSKDRVSGYSPTCLSHNQFLRVLY